MPRPVGRPRKVFSGEVVDIASTAREPPVGQWPRLGRLRDSHHQVARLLAEGKPFKEVAAETGYKLGSICSLKRDPQIRALIKTYRRHLDAIRDEVYANGHKMAAALRNDVIDLLHERILETPELVSTDTAIEIFKSTSDRTGMGPASKSTNLNVTVDLANRAAAGRQRSVLLKAVGSATAALVEGPISPGQVETPSAVPDRGGGDKDV